MTAGVFIPQPFYTIAGVGPYTVKNPYTDASHLTIAAIASGVRTVIDPADYTISPQRAVTEGNVTLSAGAAATHAGAQLEILRDTLVTQPWVGANSSREKGIEAALDTSIFALQDYRRDADRALVFPVESGLLPQIPQLAASRAGKFLGFDSLGNPTASLSGPTGTPVSSFMETFLAAINQAAALAELGATSDGIALLQAVDKAAQRAALGLGSAALMADSAEEELSTAPNAAARRGLVKAYVDSLAVAPIPAGAVFWFAANSPPTGYLECNGATISRTTYAGLFAVIGDTFGEGDGSTTFELPDLRGEFIRGWDSSRGVDDGRVFGSAQADELKAHTHTITTSGSDTVSSPPNNRPATSNTNDFQTKSTNTTGGTETRPRNVALLPCIKT